MQRGLRRPRDPVLQLRDLRPVLHGLRRHRARRPASAPPGMTFEKTDSDPAQQARRRAVPDAVDDAVRGGAATSRRSSTAGTTPGSRRATRARGRARAQRGRAARERGPAAGARHHRAPVLPPRRRPGEGARGAGARAPAAADGRRGPAADARRSPCRDYTPYGRATRADALPAGTYVVSMAQRQKHWVQAMLNEDTYTPFPYFYDVTAWSQPLLFDVEGGYSGAALAMRTSRCRQCRTRASPALPADPPRSRCTRCRRSSRAGSSRRAGCAGCSTAGASPYRDVTAERDRRRAASPAPTCCSCPTATRPATRRSRATRTGSRTSGRTGQRAIREWVQGGGRYVGWLDGAVLAAALGVSSATFETPRTLGISSPGASSARRSTAAARSRTASARSRTRSGTRAT